MRSHLLGYGKVITKEKASHAVVKYLGELKRPYLTTFEEELLNYSDSDCRQMQEICDHIRKLRNHGKLEASAQAVLKCLRELKRPYLTEFEEER